MPKDNQPAIVTTSDPGPLPKELRETVLSQLELLKDNGSLDSGFDALSDCVKAATGVAPAFHDVARWLTYYTKPTRRNAISKVVQFLENKNGMVKARGQHIPAAGPSTQQPIVLPVLPSLPPIATLDSAVATIPPIGNLSFPDRAPPSLPAFQQDPAVGNPFFYAAREVDFPGRLDDATGNAASFIPSSIFDYLPKQHAVGFDDVTAQTDAGSSELETLFSLFDDAIPESSKWTLPKAPGAVEPENGLLWLSSSGEYMSAHQTHAQDDGKLSVAAQPAVPRNTAIWTMQQLGNIHLNPNQLDMAVEVLQNEPDFCEKLSAFLAVVTSAP